MFGHFILWNKKLEEILFNLLKYPEMSADESNLGMLIKNLRNDLYKQSLMLNEFAKILGYEWVNQSAGWKNINKLKSK
jgi:hypothetical protein